MRVQWGLALGTFRDGLPGLPSGDVAYAANRQLEQMRGWNLKERILKSINKGCRGGKEDYKISLLKKF